ncbi:precorrin-6A reductase [Tropicimonas isoalkanivorans]|uniref:Precorrin-6A reductase n=2 Tax=Tropicimonas isoalkanivorans TaxID=441112 RepID=A0A1I1LMT3_9RHOB|nr:precorrin-6A reductase [Tropicimonas isoalkanivorans]
MILGGTTEARELAEFLVSRGVEVLISLSGATERPADLPGTIRRGGFGGPQGMAAVLAEHRIAALVDATHPFAARITANAVWAADTADCPLLLLRRPPWVAPPGADWRHFDTLPAAVEALPHGACALMATGSGSAPALAGRSDVRFILRSIEPVPGLPPHATNILARPPFPMEAERELLIEHGISHLVTRNSGGQSGTAKLRAAADLDLRVFVVDRPPPPEGAETAETVPSALDWLAALHLLDTPSDRTP